MARHHNYMHVTCPHQCNHVSRVEEGRNWWWWCWGGGGGDFGGGGGLWGGGGWLLLETGH